MTSLAGDLRRELDLADALKDPVRWVEEVAKEELWSRQKQIMHAVQKNRKVAVPSAHGVGKDFTAARLIAWWVAAHPPVDTFVLTTAPSADQLRGVLWRELQTAHEKAGLGGVFGVTQWTMPVSNGKRLVCIGRKPADYRPEALQGYHAKYLLCVLDEADGVPKTLWDAVGTLVTAPENRVLAIGNPDRPSGPFFDACLPASGFEVIRIPVFDNPNFTDERDSVSTNMLQNLSGPVWVEEKRLEWGEQDPRWSSKVLALPPSDDPHSVISLAGLWTAVLHTPYPDGTPVQVGVDVGGGGDPTVCWEMRGSKLGRRWSDNNPRPEDSADGVIAFCKDVEATKVVVDQTGIGHHLVGVLRKGLPGVTVYGFMAGGARTDPKKFKSARAELWWEVGRECLGHGDFDLSALNETSGLDLNGRLVNGPEIVRELAAPKWEKDLQGKIVVEEKSDLRKRIGRSTNDSDAILLAAWRGVQRSSFAGLRQVAKARLRVST